MGDEKSERLEGAPELLGMLQSENRRLREDATALRQELHALSEKHRAGESENFERTIRWREVLFREKLREAMLKEVLPIVQIAIGAIASKASNWFSARRDERRSDAPKSN